VAAGGGAGITSFPNERKDRRILHVNTTHDDSRSERQNCNENNNDNELRCERSIRPAGNNTKSTRNKRQGNPRGEGEGEGEGVTAETMPRYSTNVKDQMQGHSFRILFTGRERERKGQRIFS